MIFLFIKLLGGNRGRPYPAITIRTLVLIVVPFVNYCNWDDFREHLQEFMRATMLSDQKKGFQLKLSHQSDGIIAINHTRICMETCLDMADFDGNTTININKPLEYH